MFDQEGLRHYKEYFAYQQTVTATLVNGAGGVNPQTIQNAEGQFGVSVTASGAFTIPAGGNVTVRATSSNGSIETLQFTNSGTTTRSYADTEEICVLIFSPRMRDNVTVALSSTGTGKVDVNPSFRTR